MNFEGLNKWTALVANISVLIGIIFLIVELNQSNSIANRDSQTQISALGFEINRTTLENPNFSSLRAKLRTKNVELNAQEVEEAFGWATVQINFWSLVAVSYNTGLLSEAMHQAQINGAIRLLNRYPGLRPFVQSEIEELGIDQSLSGIFFLIQNELAP